MTSTRPLTASERYARFVLNAWNKREFAELQTALTELPFKGPGNLPAAEYERMDLIQDLGRDLLMSDSSAQVANRTDQEAALALVRHLARCE
jgi:hypothetical protein